MWAALPPHGVEELSSTNSTRPCLRMIRDRALEAMHRPGAQLPRWAGASLASFEVCDPRLSGVRDHRALLQAQRANPVVVHTQGGACAEDQIEWPVHRRPPRQVQPLDIPGPAGGQAGVSGMAGWWAAGWVAGWVRGCSDGWVGGWVGSRLGD